MIKEYSVDFNKQTCEIKGRLFRQYENVVTHKRIDMDTMLDLLKGTIKDYHKAIGTEAQRHSL